MSISHCQPLVQDKLDDWAGLKDAAERRKVQNRVHQRSRRKALLTEASWNSKTDMRPGRRKATEALLNLEGGIAAAAQGHTPQQQRLASSSAGPFGVLVPTGPAQTDSLDLLREHSQILALSQKATAVGPRMRHVTATASLPDEQKDGKQLLIPPLIPYIKSTSDISTIRPVMFPISLDHRLITLIQYNVLRAMLINMTVLSLEDMMPEECGAAFTFYCLPPRPHKVPPSLHPTVLQQTCPHPVWIGTVPDPGMRDNLIKNYGRFDDDDLCCDMLGGLYEGFNDVERRGMIAWSDPWTPDGWEVTEGFARKWGYLLKGCGQLMLSTNRWRARRGEEPLIFEI